VYFLYLHLLFHFVFFLIIFSWSDWVSFLAYPNLFGIKGFVVDFLMVNKTNSEQPSILVTTCSKLCSFAYKKLTGTCICSVMFQVMDLMVPLRELGFADPNVTYHLWVLVFPIVWITLQKEEQVALAKPMIALLSKDYHKRQQGNRPNVVQAILEGLHLSHPQPRMPSELIKYIGKTYNAWHISLALLESHVMLFSNDVKCSESLAELYRLLNEEDMWCGLWKRRSITAETRAGLSLVQHGYWQQAQNLFYQAMIKATQGTYNNAVPKSEMCLWEEQWLHCAGQMSQWEVLSDFGKSVENYEILLDSLWKVPEWAYMKENVMPRAQVEETPKLRLIQAFFSLHDKGTAGVGEAENLVSKGVELALEQWWQLPEHSVQARTPLLQQFQQLVEVQESSRILMDIASGSKAQTPSNSGANPQSAFADLKDILETWRLRTPNEWDSMTVWYVVCLAFFSQG
jgi:transformation/transcription domain-associated protein